MVRPPPTPTPKSKYHLLTCKAAQLEIQRQSVRQALWKGLMDPIHALLKKEYFDARPTKGGQVNHSNWQLFGVHDDLQVSGYLRELNRSGLWPVDLHDTTVDSVLGTLASRFQETDIGTSMGFKMHGRRSDCLACTYDPRATLTTLIARVRAEAKGLCLDCLRRGAPPTTEAPCRCEHS